MSMMMSPVSRLAELFDSGGAGDYLGEQPAGEARPFPPGDVAAGSAEAYLAAAVASLPVA